MMKAMCRLTLVGLFLLTENQNLLRRRYEKKIVGSIFGVVFSDLP